MENDNVNISEQADSKEYKIPELVNLNSVSEAMGGGIDCPSGSSATGGDCIEGTGAFH
jgi:hypothetical protein